MHHRNAESSKNVRDVRTRRSGGDRGPATMETRVLRDVSMPQCTTSVKTLS